MDLMIMTENILFQKLMVPDNRCAHTLEKKVIVEESEKLSDQSDNTQEGKTNKETKMPAVEEKPGKKELGIPDLDEELKKMGFDKFLKYPEIKSKKSVWVIWMNKGFIKEKDSDLQQVIDALGLI